MRAWLRKGAGRGVAAVHWVRRAFPYKIAYAKRRLREGYPARTILFYPQRPQPQHVIYKVLHLLGHRITGDPLSGAGLVVRFQSGTLCTDDDTLVSLSKKREVLNMRCRDISKENVEQVFRRVFGYGMAVDPRTHQGLCVRKSNRNAAHDGRIAECPLEPEEGYTYQIVIDNRFGDLVQDIRTPIMKGTIPFVYYKYRTVADRFGNENVKAHMVPTAEAFSDSEVTKILEFAGEMGLDFGELDVLRDCHSKRIYIVDVNKTPFGPPNHIEKGEYKAALHKLAESFEERFLSSARL